MKKLAYSWEIGSIGGNSVLLDHSGRLNLERLLLLKDSPDLLR